MSFGFFRLLSHALLCFDNSIPKEICQPVNIHFVLLPNILICHFYRIKNLHKKPVSKPVLATFLTWLSASPVNQGLTGMSIVCYFCQSSHGLWKLSCSLFSSHTSCLAFQNRFVSVSIAFSAIPETPARRMASRALSSSCLVIPENTSIS